MNELLMYLVKALVDNPDDVSINEVEGEKALVFEVKVNAADAGKVIGKHGRIINAIRTIIRSAAVKDGKKVSVELIG